MTVTEQRFGGVQGVANAGYVRSVWLLRCVDVLAVLDPSLLPVPNQPMTVSAGGLLVAVDALVTKLLPPTRTARWQQTDVLDRAGKTYSLSLTLSLPRPSAALTEYLYRHQAVRWVAFWLDGNGQGWVGGEPDNGLRLTMTQSQAEQNVLGLTLTGKSAHPAWRLETTDLATLFPDAAFDYSFDLSFDS